MRKTTMKIRELFVKPIDRAINGVIKADQKDAESVWQELDEYVVTRQLADYMRRFFDAWNAVSDRPNDPAVTDRMGVWVSGFFGSGKSHFIKILSYLLPDMKAASPSTGEEKTALGFFDHGKIADPMLLGDVRRAVSGKTEVVLFNIDAKADSKNDRDAILMVFLRVFNELQGYFGGSPHIADMERFLDAHGVYEKFKEAYLARTGREWVADRNAAGFRRDAIVATLADAQGISPESAAKWFDAARADYKINIIDFSKLVCEYLDRKGPGHRIAFLVDEVGQFIGKNTQLMLNLQTITEELGTHCKGRAWVIVTSQEDIDATLGEINDARSHDFSKIQGRFHTRLSLSSSNTDEVIAKRLLEKSPEAREALLKLFAEKGDIVNNQLSFVGNAVALRGFKDGEDFATHYPFAPYQFQLLQKIFESIRKVGATGRHLSRGERSLLDAFQSAARRNAERDIEALVPLYDFFPSIESFLDSSVKRAVDQAGDNPALEPWDSQLLRALFLIRYIPDTVKPTLENLATLCVDRVDADKHALKRTIEDSLNRLERQNLISRSGDLWFFLTNEERDVSQEIKAVEVSSAEISRLLSEMVFDDILAGANKVRHRETKADYEYNRLLDGTPWRQANNELTFEVLTPLGDDYELMTEARCIGRSAEGAGRAIARLSDKDRLDVELRTYVQIEKYIVGPKADSATPSLKQILRDRKDENRERRSRLVSLLSDLVAAGDFYALGQKPAFKASTAAGAVDEVLNYLVSNTYTKLAYIKVRQDDPIAEIRAVLAADDIGQKGLALGGEEGNPQALAEMRQYLMLAASQSRVLLSDVVDRFGKAPWGWKPDWEVVLLVARLFMSGELKLVAEGTDLDPKSAVDYLTKSVRFRSVSILKRKTADAVSLRKAKDLHREMFGKVSREDEDGLCADFRENLGKWKADLEGCKHAASEKHRPGKDVVDAALARLARQLAVRDPFEFVEGLVSDKDGWLNAGEDVHDVTVFYSTQIGVWRRMLDALVMFSDNRDALLKDDSAAAALRELEFIRDNPAPYGLVPRIEGLVATVETVNTALAGQRRERALMALDGRIAEASKALDEAHADPDLRNRVLKPLQDLKAHISSLSSIPRILYMQDRSAELLDDAMAAIAAAVKAKITPSTPPAGEGSKPAAPAVPVPVARPVKVVRLADIPSKTYLESEAEVDEYIEALRKVLLETVKSGSRARVQ